jgi:peptidoglycan/LPS O-acetylase OafA/YrhL
MPIESHETGSTHGASATLEAGRGHLPALDGLRGVAILLVLAVHLITMGGGTPRTSIDRCLPQIASVGWSGVNLFFVLSGFLITGIVYDAKGRADGLKNFYARRVLRIFPLYYAVLTIYFLFYPRLFPAGAENVRGNWHYQAWLWLYGVNWGLYFSPHGFPNLGHFWSLAIEEHFYLVWPFIIRSCSRQVSMKICAALIIVAALFRFGWIASGQPAGFVWVLDPSHFDGLALGSLIALAARGPGGLSALRRPALWAALICSNMVIFLFGYMREALHVHWRFQLYGWTPLVLCFGSALVLVILAPRQSFIGKVFHSRVLRFFGTYSYGIYVYHCLLSDQFHVWFPTEVFQRALGSYIPAVLLYALLATLVSVAVSWVSYHGFEKPILKLKDYFPVQPETVGVPHWKPAVRRSRETSASGR